MFASHLIGVWLLTATWINPQYEALSEPYEIRTYETKAECFAAVDTIVNQLQADQPKLKQMLNVFPGSAGIKVECRKQAVEM